MDKRIAVLIPCYNEGKTIQKVIENFYNQLQGFNFKIYAYDNNSSDDTKIKIENTVNENVIYKFYSKQGKGNVVREMFRDIEADYYILVDGDNTYPAETVSKMINIANDENIDMLIGDRLSSNYHSENKRLFHSFGNKLVCNLINSLFNSNIKDIMSGYRILSKRFVKNLSILSKGFEIETEMTIMALDLNFNIKEIPIHYSNRIEGSESKLNTYTDGFMVLKTIFILFKDYKPFEFFGILAILFFVIATVLFIPIFISFLQTGVVLKFPTLFVSIGIYIISLLTFGIGVILSTIVKLYKRDREISILNNKNYDKN